MQGHTTCECVETLALFDEAVHFYHLSDCSIRPPFMINDFLDLLAKRLGMLRIFGQVVKSMDEGLRDTFVTHS